MADRDKGLHESASLAPCKRHHARAKRSSHYTATRAIASLSANHPSFTRTSTRARAHTHTHTYRELEDVGLKLRDTLTSNLPQKQTATPREQGGGQAGGKEGGVWRRF